MRAYRLLPPGPTDGPRHHGRARPGEPQEVELMKRIYPPLKPWLAKQSGETNEEWRTRLNHTCLDCGRFEADLDVLDKHEVGHGSRHDG